MEAGDTLVSFGSVAAWKRAAALLVGAVAGRWRAVAGLVMLFVAAGVGAMVLLPRTYTTEAQLLVQRNYVMPALAHPSRSVPAGADSPTQAAVEFVLNRQALEGLVVRHNLMARWDEERPGLLRFKDRMIQTLSGPPTPDDRLDALVEVLGRRIFVNVEGDVITVRASWWTARTALDVVNGAVESYLEARRKIDVQSIADTSALLERTVEAQRLQVQEQLSALRAIETPPLTPARQTEAGQARLAAVPAALPAAPPAAAPAVASVASPTGQSAIAVIRHRDLTTRLDEARRLLEAQRLGYDDAVRSLRTRVTDSEAMGTDRHPDVVAARRALAKALEEPEELRAARESERRLLAEYAAELPVQVERPQSDTSVRPPSQVLSVRRQSASSYPLARTVAADDELLTYSRAIFRNSLDTYQDLLTRLANARIELETAKAAFGYRYSVTRPAQRPKKPSAPGTLPIMLGALMAGLVAGVTAALLRELQVRALLAPAALASYLTASGVGDAA